MTRVLTLQEANLDFTRCVREVETGEEFVITRDGRPVARLLPVSAGQRKLSAAQEAALSRMEARIAKAARSASIPTDKEPFDRDRLHER